MEATNKSAEAFFQPLPDDELSTQELALRQAILDYLEAHASDPSPPLLSDACKDRQVTKERAALLPPEVPLRLWLDRRVGGEVEVVRNEKTQLFVVQLRGSAPPKDNQSKEDSKDKFFESLPDDSFTRDEERLREAILGFLDNWKDNKPPTLSNAGSDPEIAKSRKLVLPAGTPVSLKEWIDRRMGGEIEMMPDSTGQVCIGLRGELDHAAVTGTGKRKAEGVDTRSKGRGKDSGKDGRGASSGGSGSGGPPWKKGRGGDGKGAARR
jgi:hypothetical protein